MAINKRYGVRVPATTANIGSGFDTLGLALGLYNEAYFTPEANLSLFESSFDVQGEGVREIKTGANNMILKAMQAVGEKVGKAIPGGRFRLINNIPLDRGMGSSSAALVAGAFLANQFLGNVLNRHDILAIVTKIEGHPDNVAPAIFGGFCISLMKKDTVYLERIEAPSLWKAAVVIPDFKLKTEEARKILPDTYSRREVVQNIGAVSFLLTSIMLQRGELLRLGMADCIHVPYRLTLIPGAEEAIENAEKRGCYGATISGSGPTMIAFSSVEKAYEIGNSMMAGFKLHDIASRFMVLDFDQDGAKSIQLDNY